MAENVLEIISYYTIKVFVEIKITDFVLQIIGSFR